MLDLSHEQAWQGVVCGVDEAGRGPWAGPVVAAAVVLDVAHIPNGIHDSKKLSAIKREALFEAIMTHARSVGVGVASVQEIDAHNILQATFMAMQRAVAELDCAVDAALVDGNRAPTLHGLQVQTLVKGDSKSLSIAAASIIAKVTRDRMMSALAQDYPQYGFERHAGYGTAQHQQALAQHGVTPHHRTSYAPIRALLEAQHKAA